jgi:hypothetical protein
MYEVKLLLLLVALASVGCQSARQDGIYQAIDEDKIQVGIISADDLVLEVAYIGAIGHSYIFECTLENLRSEEIVIDKSQFYLDLGHQDIVFCAEEDHLIEGIKADVKRYKIERKNSTAINILGAVSAVLSVATPGVSVAETVVFSAEPIFAIFDDRRWYKRGIKSLEDEIVYIDQAQYDKEVIRPYNQSTRDLLFPTTFKIERDLNLVWSFDDQEYVITFPKEIF